MIAFSRLTSHGTSNNHCHDSDTRRVFGSHFIHSSSQTGQCAQIELHAVLLCLSRERSEHNADVLLLERAKFLGARRCFSVKDLTTNTDILSDGGFESHSWSNWSPYNSIYYGSAMQMSYSGTGPRSGSWFYSDVQYTRGDGIYQNVTTVVGRNHSIEFYLANPQGGNVSLAVVSISP